MTPEKDISRIVASVCAQSGHWPYTGSAELYIGYRPGEERMTFASDRILRTQVSYDIVIAAKRGGAAEQMEAMRYKLYAALLAAGWRIEGDPGPETYVSQHGLFLWPVTAARAFAIGADGQPHAPGSDLEV